MHFRLPEPRPPRWPTRRSAASVANFSRTSRESSRSSPHACGRGGFWRTTRLSHYTSYLPPLVRGGDVAGISWLLLGMRRALGCAVGGIATWAAAWRGSRLFWGKREAWNAAYSRSGPLFAHPRYVIIADGAMHSALPRRPPHFLLSATKRADWRSGLRNISRTRGHPRRRTQRARHAWGMARLVVGTPQASRGVATSVRVGRVE